MPSIFHRPSSLTNAMGIVSFSISKVFVFKSLTAFIIVRRLRSSPLIFRSISLPALSKISSISGYKEIEDLSKRTKGLENMLLKIYKAIKGDFYE